VVNEKIVFEMSKKFGYPESYVKQSLENNEANYCTALYYLMQSD